jgi:L-asparaginase
MTSQKPLIRVIASGGTISAKASDGSGYFSPALAGEELVRAVPGLGDAARVKVENFSKVLSSQLTVEQVYGLARRVRTVLAEEPDLSGVVVTHGTGAMEESSFLADLLHDDARPVVFTGAMRGASDPFTDGPFNLYNAVRIAASPEARGHGVMVALNSLIHPARDIYKSHTTGADTFRSGEFGPLGYAYPDRIHFARTPLLRRVLNPAQPELNVDLIKFAVGMDDRFIRASVAAGAKGIVIEGSGLGNVNDLVADGIAHALASSVTVVVCSRSTDGRVFPSYGTKAGAASLVAQGCILASLSGTKARIMLMLALGVTRDRSQLQALFDPAVTEGAWA